MYLWHLVLLPATAALGFASAAVYDLAVPLKSAPWKFVLWTFINCVFVVLLAFPIGAVIAVF